MDFVQPEKAQRSSRIRKNRSMKRRERCWNDMFFNEHHKMLNRRSRHEAKSILKSGKHEDAPLTCQPIVPYFVD